MRVLHSIIVLLALNSVVTASHYGKNINQLNLLMPILQKDNQNREISYVLEAYNGCYEWTSSHPHILEVQSINDEDNERCASKAKIVVKAKSENKNIVWLTATDLDTRLTLKCEAKVAKIAKIEIITKMRTIDVGDYESFELIGYDFVGNAFTSLEGLMFEWSISQENLSLAKFVSFKEASVLSTPIRHHLEEEKYETDIRVMKGIETGWVEVTAQINEKDYTHINSKVKIAIREHFILYPERELYVLPYSTVVFDLFSVKINSSGTRHHKIGLPNDNYLWSLENSKIGDLTKKGILICDKGLVSSKVFVKDTRGATNKVESKVTIVEPWRINVRVKECEDPVCKDEDLPLFLRKRKTSNQFSNSFSLIHNKRYLIRSFVSDKLNNDIYLTENVSIDWKLPKDLTVIENRGFEVVVETNRLFSTKIGSAVLAKVKYGKNTYKIQKDISATKEISVYMPIALVKPAEFINIPFLKDRSQSVNLWVLGGSGKYNWNSTDSKIAVVNASGKVIGKEIGFTEIVVSDKTNPQNTDKITVYVSKVGTSHFVERMKEIQTNTQATTLLYSVDEQGRRFTDCSSIPYEVSSKNNQLLTAQKTVTADFAAFNNALQQEMTENSFLLNRVTDNGNSVHSSLALSKYSDYLSNNQTSEKELLSIFNSYRNYGICGSLSLSGLKLGENELTASFKGSNHTTTQSQQIIDSFATVAPLVDTNHFSLQEWLLAHGSSLEWGVSGGPRKWGKTKIPALSFIQDTDNKHVVVYTLDQGYNTHNIFVYCNNNITATTSTVTLESKNTQDAKLINPLTLSLAIKVKCGVPSHLKLYKIASNEDFVSTSAFREVETQKYNLVSNKNYQLQAWAFDQFIKPFYNFSSIEISWTGADETRGAQFLKLEPPYGINSLYHDETTILNLTGNLLKSLKITAESAAFETLPGKFDKISDSLNIKILDSIHIQPPFKLLLNNPEFIGKLIISGGSDSFKVISNDTSIVKHVYNPNDKTITLTPIRKGSVLITVIDESQENPIEAQAVVKVANPHHIQLALSEELVPTNTSVDSKINVFDDENNKFDKDQLKPIFFDLKFDKENVSKGRLSVDIQSEKGNEFTIVPFLKDPGFKNIPLIGTAMIPGQDTHKKYALRVKDSFYAFSEIQSFPAEVYSSSGCFFTVQMLFNYIKGLKYSFELQMKIGDESIIQLIKMSNHFATFQALKNGKTEIIAAFVEKSSGKRLKEIIIPIHINQITKIDIIYAQSRRVHIGAPVRLLAAPVFEDKYMTPSFCSFTYEWSTHHTNVVGLSSVGLSQSQATYSSNEGQLYNSHIAVNAIGVKAGSAEISVTLKAKYQGSLYPTQTYTATSTIRFIQRIDSYFPQYIGSPEAQSNIMLLPPNAGYNIKTNKNLFNLRLTQPCQTTDNLISAQTNGFLSTHNLKGLTTIKLTDESMSDNFRLINIQVTDIYSLVVENSQRASRISENGKITLKIQLQDEFGRLFASPLFNYNFNVLSTDNDVVSIELLEDGSLAIEGMKEGETLIYVFLEGNLKIFDVFKVQVGSFIFPESPVSIHVGGRVQFTISNKKGVPVTKPIWSSSDKAVIKINSLTGEATATGPGEATILLDDDVHLETVVKVFEITKMKINEGKTLELNNSIEAGQIVEHEIPATFYQNEELITSLISISESDIDNQLKLNCEVNHPTWFDISPKIVNSKTESGEKHQTFMCVLSPRSYPLAQEFPEKVIVKITLHSSQNTAYTFSDSITIAYKWAFNVIDYNSKEVSLNRDTSQIIFKVSTSREITFTTTGQISETFVKSSYGFNQKQQILTVSIPESLKTKSLKGSIVLSDSLSSHVVVIPVNYAPESSYIKTDSLNVKKSDTLEWFDLSVVFGCLIIIIVLYYMLVKKKNDGNNRGNQGRRYDRDEGGVLFRRLR